MAQPSNNLRKSAVNLPFPIPYLLKYQLIQHRTEMSKMIQV